MNWGKLAAWFDRFSLQCTKDAQDFERRYPEVFRDGRALSVTDLNLRDQVQRKRIYAELAYMLAAGIREGSDSRAAQTDAEKRRDANMLHRANTYES